MAKPHLDHPGEVHWFSGFGPAPVVGPCPHADCQHLGLSTIAWGPSLDRYELVECGITGARHGCAGRCRAWINGDGQVVTAWLQVEVTRDYCRNCRRPITLVSEVGWLHDELPKYASKPITCENAKPLRTREERA